MFVRRLGRLPPYRIQLPDNPQMVRLLNVDLSTVTAATDIVFALGGPFQEVIHLDAQAGPDADKHRDLFAPKEPSRPPACGSSFEPHPTPPSRGTGGTQPAGVRRVSRARLPRSRPERALT
jgi:hypothetical protein